MNKDNDDFEDDDDFGGGFGSPDFGTDSEDDEFDLFDGDETDENPFEDGDFGEDDFEEDDGDFADLGDDDLEDDYSEDNDDDEDDDDFEIPDDLTQGEIDNLIGVEPTGEQPEAKTGGNKIVSYAITGIIACVVAGGGYFAYTSVLAPMLGGGGNDYAYTPPQQDFVPKGGAMPQVAQQPPVNAPALPNNTAMNNAPALAPKPVAPKPAAPQPVNTMPAPPAPKASVPAAAAPSSDSGLGNLDLVNKSVVGGVPSGIDKQLADIANKMQGFEGALNVIMDNMEKLPSYFATPQQVASIVDNVVENKLANMQMPAVDNSEVVGKIANLEATIKASSMASDDNASQLSMLQNQIDYLMASKTTDAAPANDEKVASLEAKLQQFAEKIEVLEGVINSQKAQISKTQKEVKKVKAQKVSAPAVRAPVRGAGMQPPRKPSVLTNYRLAGVSRDMAWIETSVGVSRVKIGQTINGIGKIQGITQVDGNWAVVTPIGLILP